MLDHIVGEGQSLPARGPLIKGGRARVGGAAVEAL